MKKLATNIIRCFWDNPDEPPTGLFAYDKNAPFIEREIFSVPEVGETIVLDLDVPETVGIPIIPTVIQGEVKSIKKRAPHDFELIIERKGRIGLSYYELGACIGAVMVGYHPLIGRVEGALAGLLPNNFELAVIKMPELTDLHKAYRQLALEEGDLDEDEMEELEKDDENASVIVSWSSLWTKQGLEIMKQK